MKTAAVLLANGFEDIEAIAVIDILRRAGVNVQLVAVTADGTLQVTTSHNVRLLADVSIGDVAAKSFDLVYLPGGLPGATNLAASADVAALLRRTASEGGICSAICAAPVALDAAGMLDGVDYTCYPGFQSNIKAGNYTGARIQRSGKIITGCGPGASLEMGFELLRALGLNNAASHLLDGMLMRR